MVSVSAGQGNGIRGAGASGSGGLGRRVPVLAWCPLRALLAEHLQRPRDHRTRVHRIDHVVEEQMPLVERVLVPGEPDRTAAVLLEGRAAACRGRIRDSSPCPPWCRRQVMCPGTEFAPDSPQEGDGFELPVPRSETTISASQRGNGRWRTQEASRAAAPTDPPLRLSRQPKSGAPPPESAAESRPFFTQRGAPGGWCGIGRRTLDAGLSTRRPSR